MFEWFNPENTNLYQQSSWCLYNRSVMMFTDVFWLVKPVDKHGLSVKDGQTMSSFWLYVVVVWWLA